MKSSIKILLLFSVLFLLLACGYPDNHGNNLEDRMYRETYYPPPIETITMLPTAEIPSATPTQEMERILGDWSGTAQWMCDNNPVWQLQMSFSSDGKVSTILSSEIGSPDTVNVNWSLSGETITIQFPATVWTGIVEENEISGTFSEENCSGVWLLSR